MLHSSKTRTQAIPLRSGQPFVCHPPARPDWGVKNQSEGCGLTAMGQYKFARDAHRLAGRRLVQLEAMLVDNEVGTGPWSA